MGQQPNVRLGMEDLPRPVPHPAAPGRWAPSRPGDPISPADVPWGGAFGTPGPDSGYALRLLESREWALQPGEDRHDVEAAVAALMSARASSFGRAPVASDAEVAEALLGLRSEGLDDGAAAALAERRARLLPGIAHRGAALRSLVASLDLDVLAADPSEVHAMLATDADPFVA